MVRNVLPHPETHPPFPGWLFLLHNQGNLLARAVLEECCPAPDFSAELQGEVRLFLCFPLAYLALFIYL
jgi:hypothetical protein